jgi:hypothetical protein
LGEFSRELSRIAAPIRDAAEYLGKIDGRNHRTAGDCLGNNVGAGLVSKMREKRRGIEYGRQLLGVLARGFCTALGEQFVNHRPSGEPTEQSATLLGHGAIWA